MEGIHLDARATLLLDRYAAPLVFILPYRDDVGKPSLYEVYCMSECIQRC
jgi:hypothetical protein